MLNINSVTFVWLFFTAYGNVHSRSCLSSESFCFQTEYTARLLLLWFALICILPSVIPRNDEICQYIASSSWLRYIPFYQLGVVCQPRPQNQMANSPVVMANVLYKTTNGISGFGNTYDQLRHIFILNCPRILHGWSKLLLVIARPLPPVSQPSLTIFELRLCINPRPLTIIETMLI